jgi:hypothetical protein
MDNFLINYDGPISYEEKPLRSLFPVRYYVNDFEFSVDFEPSSEPSTRLVTGVPTGAMFEASKYGRIKAPEMLFDKPYCPFKTDVWQVGRMYIERCAVRFSYHRAKNVVLTSSSCFQAP